MFDLPGPPQLFVVGSTLVGLLLPTLVITRIVDGPAGLRALWRRAVAVRVAAAWYALVLLGLPLVALAITVAVDGLPADLSPAALGAALAGNLLLPLALTFLPNNWWEEVAWQGFVQHRLQGRHGPALAALLTAPLFAVQHVALVAGRPLVTAALVMLALAVLAVPFRFFTGWLDNRTASLFLVGLAHAVGNAMAGGSGFQPGLLAALYPESGLATSAHLLALAVLGLAVVAATRGRLGGRPRRRT